MTEAGPRPIAILIAALGGEGGGVLMNWIVEAARLAGYPVQATSVPGVAQRTGATTYYIELLPSKAEGAAPVMSLSPTPGEVDIMVSTELAEASRALAGGFITPDRTILIASTHRHYTNLEKMAMGDGRLDVATLRSAVEKSASKSVLFNATKLARENDVHVNAIMLGAIAGTGQLGIEREQFLAAIGAAGKAVEANRKGFELGLAIAGGDGAVPGAADGFPLSAQQVIGEAVRRLTRYQNPRYAACYIERLAPFRDADPAITEPVARNLALRMAYDDIIRVSQVKIRAGRLERIRDEVGASGTEPLHVTDFFKPGIREIADLLPSGLARKVLAWAGKKNRMTRMSWPLHIRTTTVSGFLRIWLLAKLRWWRPHSFRWQEEQKAITAWLEAIGNMMALDSKAAVEIAELSGLIKGYGSTHARGVRSYNHILDTLVTPALAGRASSGVAVRIADARKAALSDPEGRALVDLIGPQLNENAT